MFFGKFKNSNQWCFSLSKDSFEVYKEISDKEHLEIINKANAEQKIISGDEDGNPILVDPPEPTEKEKAQKRINQLEIYLKNTDWYAIRFADIGEEIPVDIKQKRQAARNEISELKEKLK